MARKFLSVIIGTLVIAGAFAEQASARIPLDNLGLGKLELSGNIQTTNIIRHRDIDTWQLIQQRNVFRTRVDWQLLRGGKLFDKWEIPFVRKGTFFLIYRFSYDSIFDFTPDVSQPYDIHGENLRALLDQEANDPNGTPGVSRDLLQLKGGLTQAERDKLKFQNSIREAYVDLKFKRIPFSLRVGRQQIVWGEADFFRMLDRVNPLDITWHGAQEVPPPSFGWDEIRRPLFMIKGLYNIGAIGPLNQIFTEFFWNPGDWYPVKVAYLPLPWGIPLLDPLSNPFDGAFSSNVPLCAQAPNQRCTRLMKGTTLLKQGDYDRWDPAENSQVGIRLHAATVHGMAFTLNYLHQRWSGDDGTPFAPIRSPRVFDIDNPDDPARIKASRLISRGTLPAEYIAPYINTFGISANYAENTYTQAVWRLETILDFGLPFFDRGKRTVLDDFVPGVTEKNMWKGMIAADRNVKIPALNKKTSFLVVSQFFWHYIINNPDCPDTLFGDGIREFQKKGGSCLTGGFDLPSLGRAKGEAFRDKVRDWEALATVAAVGFYRGGSVIPVVAYALDPVNKYVGEFIASVDWFVTPQVAFNIAERVFINPTGTKTNFGPWGFATLSRARSETSLRLTYQF